MKKTVMAIGIVVALLVAASLAMAWGPGYGRGAGYGAGPFYSGCLNAPNVNLTAEQTSRLNTLQRGFLNETLPIRNELASKALELRTLMAQPAGDAAKIPEKQIPLSDLQKKMDEVSIQYRLKARAFFTPEQLANLPSGCNLGFNYGSRLGGGRGMGRGKRY